MFYNAWKDEIHLNAFLDLDSLGRRYPFHKDMLEDKCETIVNHESMHQVLRNVAGWHACALFDKISPPWTDEYWMNPPNIRYPNDHKTLRSEKRGNPQKWR